MTEKWYQLDISCATCKHKGKTVILGTILSSVPIQKKGLDEFLSKHNDAVFICNKCAEQADRSASDVTGFDE